MTTRLPPAEALLAAAGGVAEERRTTPVELVGLVAFAWRMGAGLNYTRLAVVGALLVLFVAGGGLAAWAVAGVMTVILAALCALEAIREH